MNVNLQSMGPSGGLGQPGLTPATARWSGALRHLRSAPCMSGRRDPGFESESALRWETAVSGPQRFGAGRRRSCPPFSLDSGEITVRVYPLGSLAIASGTDCCVVTCKTGTPLVWFLGSLASHRPGFRVVLLEADAYVPYIEGREALWCDPLVEDCSVVLMSASVASLLRPVGSQERREGHGIAGLYADDATS